MNERYLNRKKKQEEWHQKTQELESHPEWDEKTRLQHENELIQLKHESTRVRPQDYVLLKEWLKEANVEFIQSVGEADPECARLVKLKRAWGVLSDDMDMFLYGVPYVLRNLNLEEPGKENVVLYDTNSVLGDLNMNLMTFREILVLSGTDFNSVSNFTKITTSASPPMEPNSKLYTVLKLYNLYQKSHRKKGFYKWLQDQNMIQHSVLNDLIHTVKMFCI